MQSEVSVGDKDNLYITRFDTRLTCDPESSIALNWLETPLGAETITFAVANNT